MSAIKDIMETFRLLFSFSFYLSQDFFFNEEGGWVEFWEGTTGIKTTVVYR